MAKDKGGKGRGNNGIRNGHLIGQGGGEIKKKPGKTFAEQAKAAKPNTGKSWVEKAESKKKANEKWTDKVKPPQGTQKKNKPNPYKKPTIAKSPYDPSRKPVALKLSKPVEKKSITVAQKALTVVKPAPKVITNKKAPAKSAIAKVQATAKLQFSPKKPSPIKTQKGPTKGK